MERLFKRDRKVEVDNFKQNEDYFKNLNNMYVDFLSQTCQTFGIDYIILDAKLDNVTKIKLINEKLKNC